MKPPVMKFLYWLVGLNQQEKPVTMPVKLPSVFDVGASLHYVHEKVLEAMPVEDPNARLAFSWGFYPEEEDIKCQCACHFISTTGCNCECNK